MLWLPCPSSVRWELAFRVQRMAVAGFFWGGGRAHKSGQMEQPSKRMEMMSGYRALILGEMPSVLPESLSQYSVHLMDFEPVLRPLFARQISATLSILLDEGLPVTLESIKNAVLAAIEFVKTQFGEDYRNSVEDFGSIKFRGTEIQTLPERLSDLEDQLQKRHVLEQWRMFQLNESRALVFIPIRPISVVVTGNIPSYMRAQAERERWLVWDIWEMSDTSIDSHIAEVCDLDSITNLSMDRDSSKYPQFLADQYVPERGPRVYTLNGEYVIVLPSVSNGE